MAETRLGQVNNAGDALALFEDIFTGEVLAAYEQTTILDGLTMEKTITAGKSASFKNTGKVASGRHTVGTSIAGANDFAIAETIINVEDRVYAVEELAEIDELMNNFNARNAISSEMGIELANQKDTDRIKEIILGARATNVITGLPGGTRISDANLASADVAVKSEAFITAIFDGMAALRANNVSGEVYVIVRPEDYYALAQNTKVLNKDWDGAGSFSEGKVLSIAGATILSSNNLKQEDSSATDTYHGVDASKTYGIMFTKDAVATVNLKGVATRFTDIEEKYATLVDSSYIAGHKFLRPEACVEFYDPTV